MPIPVIILESAETDLRELKRYLSKEFGLSSWQNCYSSIKKAVENVSHFLLSGTIPEELASLGQMQYRQVILEMKRLLYEIRPSLKTTECIYVHIIADVRKDFKSLLTKRLLQTQALMA